MLWTTVSKWVLYLLFYSCLVWTLARVARLYLRWINRQPVFAIILALLMAILFGVVGQSFGLRDLFWHPEGWSQYVAGLSVGTLILIMLGLGYRLDEESARVADLVRRAVSRPRVPSAVWHIVDTGRWVGRVVLFRTRRLPNGRPSPAAAALVPGPASSSATPHPLSAFAAAVAAAAQLRPPQHPAAACRRYLNVMFLPLALALSGPWLIAVLADDPVVDRFGDWRLVAGLLSPLAVANLALLLLARLKTGPIAHRLVVWGGLLFVALGPFLLARFSGVRDWLTASAAICSLLALIVLFTYVTYGRHMLKVAILSALIVWMALTNSDPYKLMYPGLEGYYLQDRRVRLTPPLSIPVEEGPPSQGPFDPMAFKLKRLVREVADLDFATRANPRSPATWNALGRACLRVAQLQDKIREERREKSADEALPPPASGPPAPTPPGAVPTPVAEAPAAIPPAPRPEGFSAPPGPVPTPVAEASSAPLPAEALPASNGPAPPRIPSGDARAPSAVTTTEGAPKPERGENYYRKAYEAFTESIRQAPNDPQAYIARAIALRQLMRQEAESTDWSRTRLDVYERAIRKNFEIGCNLGNYAWKHASFFLEYLASGGWLRDMDRILAEIRSEEQSDTILLLHNRAVTKFRLGDPDAALRYLGQALQMDPDRKDDRRFRANLLLEKQDLDGALRDFEAFARLDAAQALTNDAARRRAYALRGWDRARNGDLKGGLRDLREAVPLEREWSDANDDRADILVKQGLLSEALEDYARSERVSLRGDSAGYYKFAHDWRALTRARKGDWGGALEDAEEAIRRHPRDANPRYIRAIMRSKTGDFAGALRDFEEAARSRPPVSVEAVAWGDALVSRNGPDDLDRSLKIYREASFRGENEVLPSAHYRRALARYRAGDLQGALEDLDFAIRLDPGDGMSRALRGTILVRKGLVWSAFGDFAGAYGLTAPHADPYVERGIAFAVENDLRSARIDGERAVSERPEDATAHWLLASVHALEGDLDLASEDLERAIQLDAYQAGVYTLRGIVRTWEERSGEALSDFRKAATFDLWYPSAFFCRGAARLWKGDLAGAEGDLDAAIKADPRDGRAFACLGVVRALKGDRPKALDDLAVAARLDPGCLRTFADRGVVRALSGDLEGALGDLDEALRLGPGVSRSFAIRGAIHALAGHPSAAVDDLDRSTRLGCGDASIHYLFGNILAWNGRSRRALGEFYWARSRDHRYPHYHAGLRWARLMSGDFRSLARPGPSEAPEHVPLVKDGQFLPTFYSPLDRGPDPTPDIPPDALGLRVITDHAPSSVATMLVAPTAPPGLDGPPPIALMPGVPDETVVPPPPPAPTLRPMSQPPGEHIARAATPGLRKALDSRGPRNVTRPVPVSERKPNLLCRLMIRDFLSRSLGSVDHDLFFRNWTRPNSELYVQNPWRTTFTIPEPELEPGQLDDYDVLENWKKQWARDHQGLPVGRKPKLIVVATSGGGIAAAYWTALCLTELERRYPDFPRHVRVITGASGGMVGAAGYVCGLREPRRAPDTVGGPDVRKQTATGRRKDLLRLLSQDSLTPVVTQLVLSDVPAIFSPTKQTNDRGRELEKVWEGGGAAAGPDGDPAQPSPRGPAGGLGVEFVTLAPGERDGWRPSLIISPMILEGNDRLLITNLNLEGMAGGLEFFHHFHDAHLKVSTALRMNAAFPYVTPAVNLPTNPPRRVIDAGYKENYGVELAAEWLKRHPRWLAENTSGVILIQLRAYPLDSIGQIPDEQDDVGPVPPGDDGSLLAAFEAKLSVAVQWLTSPFEGVMSVNRGTMIAINNQKVDQLKTLFNETTRGDGRNPNPQAPAPDGQLPAFRTFVFTSTAMSPLSWTLTTRDKEELEKALHSPKNEQRFSQVERLLRE